MGQILDSSGKPFNVNTTALKASYASRGDTLKGSTTSNAGNTMLSKFAGEHGSEDLKAYKRLASNIEMANPSIRSPLLNQSNFYMPDSDASTGEPNRLLNQWIAYYMKWDPLVGNICNMHAELPLSRFALRGVDDPEILHFYEEMVESMELHNKMIELLKQYFAWGEVAPFAFWSEDYNCFTDLTFLDLNYLYVRGHYLLHSDEGDDVEFYELEPDAIIQDIVRSNDYISTQLKGYLDDDFISAVSQNKRLLLSNFSTCMIKNKLKWSDLRGTSIVLRCLKSLLYKDKLKEAQYVVADSHVNPKWIWKLGQAGDLASGGYMPSPEDLEAFRDLLVEANNDPMFTIITHYAVNVEAVGINGKILPIKPELDQIEKEVMTALFTNQAMTNGSGPNFACMDEATETLTENGFKKLDDIQDDEKIATFNPATDQLEYHLPMSKHVYDYDSDKDGKMVHFTTNKMNICVTPNHRMYTKRRDGTIWAIERADEIKPRASFRSQVKWEGTYQEVPKEAQDLFDVNITLADWCELAGYFISEGWTIDKPRDHRVGIRQLSTSKHYARMKELCGKVGFTTPKDCFLKCGIPIAQYFKKTFGDGCINKNIPKWMKNLPTPYLNILLTALVDGDGNRRPNTKKKPTNNKYFSYCSTSKKLADDVYEIVYKLGYVPVLSEDKVVPENHNRRFYVMWSDADTGKFPIVKTSAKIFGKKAINRVDYKGRVYCFEVPNHLFITRREGKVTIQGNTASVAFRTLMSRYIPIRAKVDRYLYQKIFAPVAYANKFYKRKAADLAHNVRTGDDESNELIIPSIDWRSKANLLDDGSVKGIISSMVGSGRLPMWLLTESLDLDYREVQSYLYNEQASIFDPVAIEARKKQSAGQTEGTMMGQPFLPKKNEPVPVSTPATAEGTAKAASKADRFLTVPPLLPKEANLEEEVTADDIQTQINKGKPEIGGNPEMRDPNAEALKLDTTFKMGGKDKDGNDIPMPRTFGLEDSQNHRKTSSESMKAKFGRKDRETTHLTATIKKEKTKAEPKTAPNMVVKSTEEDSDGA